MIDFTTLTLCDAASVRDNLIHILGGGITLLQRESFPATMDVWVAAVVQIAGETADEIDHEVSFAIAPTGQEDEAFYHAGGRLTLRKDPAIAEPHPQSIPYTADLTKVEIPAAGNFVVTATISDVTSLQLHFVAVVGGQPP